MRHGGRVNWQVPCSATASSTVTVWQHWPGTTIAILKRTRRDGHGRHLARDQPAIDPGTTRLHRKSCRRQSPVLREFFLAAGGEVGARSPDRGSLRSDGRPRVDARPPRVFRIFSATRISLPPAMKASSGRYSTSCLLRRCSIRRAQRQSKGCPLFPSLGRAALPVVTGAYSMGLRRWIRSCQ